MANGAEIDEFVKRYAEFFTEFRQSDTLEYSFLFEWTSPANQIVLFYPEPDIRLVGIVSHRDYHYVHQDLVDEFAFQYGLKRPRQFRFDTVEQLYSSVKALKGEEGVCVYYNHCQDIKKFKSLEYLAKHSFMSIVSLKECINLFMALNMPDRETMDKYLATQFDWEVVKYAQSFLDDVYKAYDNWLATIIQILDYMPHLKRLERKDAAQYILNNSFLKQYSGIVFTMLDGKDIPNETIRKFLFNFHRLKP